MRGDEKSKIFVILKNFFPCQKPFLLKTTNILETLKMKNLPTNHVMNETIFLLIYLLNICVSSKPAIFIPEEKTVLEHKKMRKCLPRPGYSRLNGWDIIIGI